MNHTDKDIFFNRLYPHFKAICKIPRPSNEEAGIVDYVKDFAKNHDLRFESDSLGNVTIYRDAAPGLENAEPLLFQGHLDMVCVPDKNIFPIEPEISEGWVHTGEKSTLGADNGIAAAIMFELMIMPLGKNPPLEFLFTVAEEVGLIGASGIEAAEFNLKAPRLINIDSEDIEYITVGCAGAKNLDVTLPINMETCRAKNALRLTVKGPGGHSGLAINDNIPNTIKIAAEIIQLCSEDSEISIGEFTGGFARNAIPAETAAVLCTDSITDSGLQDAAGKVSKKYEHLQPFTVSVSSAALPESVLSRKNGSDLINLISEIPHGVIKMNPETGGVYSSHNVAQIEQSPETMKLILNSRSCDLSAVDEILDGISDSAKKYAGVIIEKDEGYPGWRPNMESGLLTAATGLFQKIRGTKPKYLDIHAGLECGILMNKFSHIKEAISIGPNIHHAHSVKEKLEISSTMEIWAIIQEVIAYYSK